MKLGVNVANLGPASPAVAFSDLMLGCGAYQSTPWAVGNGAAPCNELGYPILPASSAPLPYAQSPSTRLCAGLGGHYPGGDYLCSWDGDGIVELGGDAKGATGGPNWFPAKIVPTDLGVYVRVRKSNPGDPVRNIRLKPADSTIGRFRPEYLAGFQYFPGPIRFKDWHVINNAYPINGVLRWADRKTPDHCSQAQWGHPVADGKGSPILDPTTGYPRVAGAGVALEFAIDLCNTLKRDMYLCLPHVATDEYIYASAAMVRDRLDPSLLCWFEYSNEVGNWDPAYKASWYCKALGTAAGDTAHPLLTGTALEYKRMCLAIEQAWPDDSRWRRVLATFGGDFKDLCTILQKLGYTRVDAFATNGYCDPDHPHLYTADTTAAQLVADLLDDITALLIPRWTALAAIRDQWAQTFGRPIALVSYECGPELIPGNLPYAQAVLAADSDPGMTAVVAQLFAAMQSIGFLFGCYYLDYGAPSQWGTYGLRRYPDSDWTTPKAAAVAAWQGS